MISASEILCSEGHVITDILFDKHHSNLLFKVQQLSTILECKTLIALIGPLFTNKNIEDTIRGSHFRTNTRQNNITLILLALFISWHQFADKFHLCGALLKIYLDYY